MSLFDEASLVITPNGVKEGKLYSIKPTDGSGDLDVVRATTATRVNSDGLIEVVPRNLAQYSEQFDNASWNKTRSSITTNVITAPNGTLTADKLIDDTTASATHQIREGISVSAGEYTMSIYAKKGEYNFIRFWEDGISGKQCYFDLENGVATNVNMTSVSIENVGNDWYRCIAVLSVSSGTFGFRINLTPNGTTVSYNGTGTDGVYLWGAQLEVGSVATSYFPTTDRLNIPRLDYTNGSCPSILLEPQRTNKLTNSEDFSSYSVSGTISTTPNYGISPSGEMNSTRVVLGSNSALYKFTAHSVNEEYSSIYIKGISGETIKFGRGTTVNAGEIFTLTGDWQRLEDTSTEGNQFSINTFTGVTARDIEIWGGQVEEGSYATSYIPTVASAVTRNADVISKTNISGLIGQTEGTILLDFKNRLLNSYPNEYVFTISGTVGNSLWIRKESGSNSYTCRLIVNNSTIWTLGFVVPNGKAKIAILYKSGNSKIFLNGSQVLTTNTSSFTGSNFSNLYLNFASTFAPELYLNNLQLYKTTLTDEQLAELTTL